MCLPWCLSRTVIACLGLVCGLNVAWWVLRRTFMFVLRGHVVMGILGSLESKTLWDASCPERHCSPTEGWGPRVSWGYWARRLLSHKIFLRVCHTQSIMLGNAILWGPRWPQPTSILLLAGSLSDLAHYSDFMTLANVVSDDTFVQKKKISCLIFFKIQTLLIMRENSRNTLLIITTHDLASRSVSAEIKSPFGGNELWNTVL